MVSLLKETYVAPMLIISLTIIRLVNAFRVIHPLHSPFSPKIDFMVDLWINKKIHFSQHTFPTWIFRTAVATTENHYHEATEFTEYLVHSRTRYLFLFFLLLLITIYEKCNYLYTYTQYTHTFFMRHHRQRWTRFTCFFFIFLLVFYFMCNIQKALKFLHIKHTPA